MKLRPKPIRRRRLKRRLDVHRARTMPGRKFLMKPEPGRPQVVELRLSRDRRRMREAANFWEGQEKADSIEQAVQGMVISWGHKPRHKLPRRTTGGIIVARMYLNVRDMRRSAMEIASHESAHAGLAYARLRNADLSVMPGEEIAAHAIGEIAWQVAYFCRISNAI